MNKMSKEKKTQVALVVLVTAIVLAGLWFGLIDRQRRSLQTMASQIAAKQRELEEIRKTVLTSKELETRLTELEEKLDTIEQGMATGDLYSWVVNAVREFKSAYKVDVPQFGQPVEKDMALIPRFPYRQVAVNIAGTAYYHDLGGFISDFENQFPYMRIENLYMEPVNSAVAEERERLAFRMDVVALIKPGNR